VTEARLTDSPDGGGQRHKPTLHNFPGEREVCERRDKHGGLGQGGLIADQAFLTTTSRARSAIDGCHVPYPLQAGKLDYQGGRGIAQEEPPVTGARAARISAFTRRAPRVPPTPLSREFPGG